MQTHTWTKAVGPRSPDPLAMNPLDKDRSRVMTCASSHRPREVPTQPVPDWPVNRRDRRLVAHPPGEPTGHLPIVGRIYAPTPKMRGYEHAPPTSQRASPCLEQGRVKPVMPPKAAMTTSASPLARRWRPSLQHASLTRERLRTSSYPTHYRCMTLHQGCSNALVSIILEGAHVANHLRGLL